MCMRITKLKLTLGRTLNLGNYETARIDVGVEAVLAEGDDIEETYSKLY